MQNNNLPDGWKIVKLKDYTTERKQKNKANEELTVFSISNKRGFVKSDDYFEGQVYSKDLKNYKIVKRGDFAYNPARINVGSIAYLESEEIGLLSPMYVIFSLNKEIDKDYFSYFIKGNLFNKQVNNFTQGAVRQILAFGDLGNISLLLPPLEVQKEIAGKLNDLDKLIQTQNNQIEKYEKLKKAMMKKLFSEGIGHTEFKEDKYLGKIPKDWEVKKIGDLFKTSSGTTPNRSNNDYFENGKYNWVKTLDLNDRYIIKTEEKVTELALKETSLKMLSTGTILVAMYGGFNQIGRTGILKIEASTNQAITALYPNEKTIPEFINYNLIHFRYKWKGIAGSSRKDPNINKNDILNFKIYFPKFEEQKKIADILENIDNLLEKEREIKESYEKVKKGIVSLVFSCNLLIK